MTRKFIGFAATSDDLKKMNYLKDHLSKFSINDLTTSDILRYLLSNAYDEYKK